MGSNTSCLPQCGRKHSRKRRNQTVLGGQVRSNSFFNIINPVINLPNKDILTKEVIKGNVNVKLISEPSSLAQSSKNSIRVKNLGKILFYSKVKFKFQHCQDVHDCYLELLQTHLHFLSTSSKGLTYEGMLPSKEITISPVETENNTSTETHSFKITGPFLNPIIVYCSSKHELQEWLDHFEKQMVNIENLDPSHQELTLQSKNNATDGQLKNDELRKSVQNQLIQEWKGTQRESLGSVIWVSKIKLQHLPFTVQHERLLVLYTNVLVILSEENNSLYYKGELSLSAITISLEECETTPNSFIIQGSLINPIKVNCQSITDFKEWLYHLKANGVTVQGALNNTADYNIVYTPTDEAQAQTSSRRSSSPLSESWNTSTVLNRNTTTLFQLPSQNNNCPPERQSFAMFCDSHTEQPLSPDYREPLCYAANPSSLSTVLPSSTFCRGGSARFPSRKPVDSSQQRHSAPEKNCNRFHTDNTTIALLSPVYAEPYNFPPSQSIDRSHLCECNRRRPQNSYSSGPSPPSSLIRPENASREPLSPIYAKPYTPTMRCSNENLFHEDFSRSHDYALLWQKKNPSEYSSCPFQTSHHPTQKNVPQFLATSNQSEETRVMGSSVPRTTLKLLPLPPSDPFHHTHKSCTEKSDHGSVRRSGANTGMSQRQESSIYLNTSHHIYTELCQRDCDYDNLWDDQEKLTPH
ncbi:pleckstrin homology domain-containing family N member 1 isoform X2 [Latimeria chalumnae]|uniref:pleckstrin homology domain-containing family N member 1 isoform X2 n=1 Tax=Latimeria chalumnae TaxID=7897 RepID=UPI0003C12AB4|nr:PREDICTED: pleckstrin homology domain-containing family N member 1 isoform X2 [Latimeria chalumnae]|eukprot:XP_005986050.1 PREDICTED: pleckstrin homology domain-containing family N member 1 isoform X2 [Latimeria chalumnae]